MDDLAPKQDAFVLRMKTGEGDKVSDGLEDEDIIIGWSGAEGLLEENGWTAFREIVHQAHYQDEENYRRSGAAAGNLWRFIHGMEKGDLVVVPHGSEFYVAEVTGPPRDEDEKRSDDTRHRRSVNWLNEGEPIARKLARSALQSRMKARQTCVDATDIIEDIYDVLEAAQSPEEREFRHDLKDRLIEATLDELRTGRINPRGFEHLVADILRSAGGENVEVIPRQLDKGADVVATFTLAETIDLRLAAQAKHWKPDPPVGADMVDQLAEGMEAEDAGLGWVVTTGTFDETAEKRRDELQEERGFRIELVNGEQLAALVIESGLRKTMPYSRSESDSSNPG